METLFFYIVALVVLGSGLIVILSKNPVNSALGLVNTFFCLAIFYVMLYAPFMAAVQIMVYAGAIMVLILFVIMLLNLGTEMTKRHAHGVLGGQRCRHSPCTGGDVRSARGGHQLAGCHNFRKNSVP